MNWTLRSEEQIEEQSPEEIINILLRNRGITDIDSFLNPSPEHFYDPFLLNNVREASERIISAIENRKKILIYGDYDADGISAISLLLTTFRKLNAEVEYYIPHRLEEGYGLSEAGIRKAADSGVNLIITVDCGTNAVEEIKLASDLGMEMIITDHHTPEKENPCDIIINPKLSPDYPYKELAGVGVAFKLSLGLEKMSNLSQNFLFWNLDLVALGTVADVMPLTGENRVIVTLGLKIMNERKRPGINALLDLAGHKGKIKAHHIGFVLGPRINAMGRLTEAREAVELLTTQNKIKARELAGILEKQNRERRKIQERIMKEAFRITTDKGIPLHENGIVLSDPGWHEGIVGIVASKIKETYYRPTILIAENDDICKGSGRSISEINIMETIEECKDYLEDFGGHPQACGISIKKENIKDFRNAFNTAVGLKLKGKNLEPELTIDSLLSIHPINKELIKKMDQLAPFGIGNPIPIFATFNLEVTTTPKIVGKNHLRFTVKEGNKILPAIAFSQGEKLDLLKKYSRIDIAYSPFIDDWRGEPTLKVHDIRGSNLV